MYRVRNGVFLFIFLISLFAGTGMLCAQSGQYSLQQLDIGHGLPAKLVFSIVQDQSGIIWFSTPGQIHQYDSENFTSYSYQELGISESGLCDLVVDQHNRIWYCQLTKTPRYHAIGILDPESHSVISIDSLSQGKIHSHDVVNIIHTKDKLYLVTIHRQVYTYDNHFTFYCELPEGTPYLYRLKEAKDGSLWASTRNHLYRIRDGIVTDTFDVGKDIYVLMRIITESPELVVACEYGIFEKKYYVFRNGEFIPYHYSGLKGYSDLISLRTDADVILSNDTLMVFDQKGNRLFQTEPPHDMSYGFRSTSTCLSQEGILWIGSTQGLFKLIKRISPFEVLQQGQSIRGISRFGDNLYVGSYSENVRLDLTTGTKKPFLHIYPEAICSFVPDAEGNIWMGSTSPYFYRYNPAANQSKAFNIPGAQNIPLVCLHPDGKSLYLGTGGGLFLWNTALEKATPVSLGIDSSDLLVRQFVSVPEGIWIVTSYGLFLINPATNAVTETWRTQQGLPTDNLLYLYPETEDLYWLGTKGAGLIRWDRKKGTFTSYNEDIGLYNGTVYAILEDDHHNLWLPGNWGLIEFNKVSGHARLFLEEDGIPHKEFNTFAYNRDHHDNFYFGGLNGLVRFRPDSLPLPEAGMLPLRLHAVRVLNKDKSGLDDVTARYTRDRQIRLSPANRLLELDVTLINYESNEAKLIAIMIPGIQNYWEYTTDGKFTFTNLPYGRYDIQLKGIAPATGNSSKIVTIPLIVEKPVYLQWPFLVTGSAAIILLIILGIRWRISALEKDRQRLVYEVALRTRQIEMDKDVVTRQAQELKELDNIKNRFFSNITHEFKTPLTLIIGPLEQILEKEKPSSPMRANIEGVVKNARYMLDLVTQLLDLSRIDDQQHFIVAVKGDILAYTREVVSRFETLAEKKNQHLSVQSPLQELKMTFDKNVWDKILFNLISNALKFTPPEGRISVAVDHTLLRNWKYVVLRVTDTGIGIPKEEINRIFERFYQSDYSSKQVEGGTGIGLALVRELVSAAGGDITVESEVAKGTTIEVVLPELEPDENAQAFEQVASEEMKISDMPAAVGPSRENSLADVDILVIDDNEEMRAFVRQCLQPCGSTVTEAVNGEEGLRLAKDSLPDIIISDVMMPGLNGFELVSALREDLSTSHIPIILLTARSAVKSRLQGLSLGADDYLTKPFSPAELLFRVQHFIKMKHDFQVRYKTGHPEPVDSRFKKEDEFITRLKSYILLNLNEPDLNGDRIGAQFAMSRVHLYRKLKALTSQSISDIVRQVRLEKAHDLLKEGKLNVSEVAYETGFSSSHQFSRAFKKAYGISPSKV